MIELTPAKLTALAIGIILATGLVIGMIVTPYVHGQPLLLTQENRQVKDYLDTYSTRLTAAEKEHANLAALLSPTRPGANAQSVFDLSQKARTAQANLNDLASQVEQTHVPGGLASLDQALRAVLAAELAFADQTLTFVGRGDEETRATALGAAENAKTALTAARAALTATLR